MVLLVRFLSQQGYLREVMVLLIIGKALRRSNPLANMNEGVQEECPLGILDA